MRKSITSANTYLTKLSGEQDPFAQKIIYLYYALFLLAYLLLLFFSPGMPFFNDTVIFSQQARFFFHEDIWKLSLPDEYYTGNPELFPLYLSWIWRIFGKSLLVSHLAMLPFIITFTWQVFILAKRIIPTPYLLPALTLILIDPTLQAQAILFSKSIVIVAFFLMAVNQIFYRNNFLMGLALSVLVFTDITGMVLIVAVLLTDLLITAWIFKSRQAFHFQNLKPYIFASFILVLWISISQFVMGRTPYAFPDLTTAQGFTTFGQVLMNGLQVDLNLIDYGRVGYWIFILIYLIRWLIRPWREHPAISILVITGILATGIMEISIIFYDVAIKARYFLFAYVIFPVLFIAIASYNYRPFILSRRLSMILAAVILASGHFWIFPHANNRDWDAAHGWMPWAELARNEIQAMQSAGEPVSAFIPFNLNKAAFLNDSLPNFNRYKPDTSHRLLIYNVMRNHQTILDSMQNKGWKIKRSKSHLWITSFLLEKKEPGKKQSPSNSKYRPQKKDL